jgi:type I restriction-modification system DNA methylase subunit
MSVKNWLTASLLLPGLCLGALPALARQQQQQSGQQSGDPVADAARKAREQQKNAPKPKKVYTDDDIKPATPASSTGAGAQAGPAGGGPTTPDSAPGTAGKEDAETVWKKRFADQRNKIASSEKELDILQRESEKAQVQYYNDPQKALTEQFTRKDINDKNAKIEQKKQEIANLKKQLEDMEDELRKSGGDPGWARE